MASCWQIGLRHLPRMLCNILLANWRHLPRMLCNINLANWRHLPRLLTSYCHIGYVYQRRLTSCCQTGGICQRHDYGTVLGQRTGSELRNIQDCFLVFFYRGCQFYLSYMLKFVFIKIMTHTKRLF